jgi:hypothetical protein
LFDAEGMSVKSRVTSVGFAKAGPGLELAVDFLIRKTRQLDVFIRAGRINGGHSTIGKGPGRETCKWSIDKQIIPDAGGRRVALPARLCASSDVL